MNVFVHTDYRVVKNKQTNEQQQQQQQRQYYKYCLSPWLASPLGMHRKFEVK